MTDTDIRYPLSWPASWPRSKMRSSSRFDPKGTRSFAAARDELIRELDRLGANRVILSSNIPLRKDGLPYASFKVPDDPGVAVYFHLKERPIALACDAWDRVVDNVWAIARHIDALRGQQRWGVGSIEQAFLGYQALPDADAVKPWWIVLGVKPDADWEAIKTAYRSLVKQHHPDVGGDRALWDRIQAAYEQACLAVMPV